MKILILTQYYKPEPLPKAAELAESLSQRGHEITIITGFPNYPSGNVYPGYALRPWSITPDGKIRVVRLPLYPDHSKSALRRMLNYGSFAATASFLGPLFSGAADVMFVFHPPLTIGISAFVISRLRRVPFVYGLGDLWPEAIVASGMIRNPRTIDLLERMERFVYTRAAAVAVVTPAMVDHLVHKGVPREKLHVISDWADEQVYRPLPRDPELAARLGLAGKFNVMFAGQVGIVQKLDTVVRAAELLRHLEQVQFVIVGDGVERSRLIGEAAARGLTNLKFFGLMPSGEMPALYALADVLLVHLSDDPIFRLSIPAKVYAYLACERPILMAVDGIAGELVRMADAGLTCRPEDPVALAETAMTFFHMTLHAREEMGRRGREAFLRDYSRTAVVTKCEALLKDVAGRERM